MRSTAGKASRGYSTVIAGPKNVQTESSLKVNVWPMVSFLIPTFNASRYLGRCLNAVGQLDYPKDHLEVIISDGGSTDATLVIASGYASRYTVKILPNHRRIAEFGKKIAFDASSGDFVVFLDSDNVIASRDWLPRMLQPFEHDGVIGVESNYLINDDFTSLNRYATLLVITDPLARLLASKPHKTIKSKSYLLKYFAQSSNPVSGANGFIWRRSAIDRFGRNSAELNEVGLLDAIAASDAQLVIGNVPSVGIYHYYCATLKDYLGKREKIAGKHLHRSMAGPTWVDQRGRWRLLVYSLYLVTIVGPSLEALKNIIKHREVAWLWHPIVSLLTIVIYSRHLLYRKLSVGYLHNAR